MTKSEARQLAAQAWCTPATSHMVLHENLADAFADILMKQVNDTSLSNSRDVKPGQFWKEINKSPWPYQSELEGRDTSEKILDVKDGWVRYYCNSLFPDRRMPIEEFIDTYKLVKDVE